MRIVTEKEAPASPLQHLNHSILQHSGDTEEVSTQTDSHLEIYIIHGKSIYEVDEILSHRTVGYGNKVRQEVNVSWLGWPDKYNTWVPVLDLTRVQQVPTKENTPELVVKSKINTETVTAVSPLQLLDETTPSMSNNEKIVSISKKKESHNQKLITTVSNIGLQWSALWNTGSNTGSKKVES